MSGILGCVTGVRLAALSVLVGLVIAGCGSSVPTAASPAPLAPTNSLVYLELTVRPQGSERDAAESALTKLLGHSPDGALQQAATKLLGHLGLSYQHDVQPWLGQKVAVVLTRLGRSGLGVIAPTTDSAAAQQALKKAVGATGSASYGGVHYEFGSLHGDRVAVGIVDHNAVLAAPSVFRKIVDASRGQSLTKSTSFASAFAALPSNSLVKGYVNASMLGAQLRPLIASAHRSGQAQLPVRHLLDTFLGKLKGAVGFSLSATSHSLAIDVHSTVTHPGASADVRDLPAQTWLALASNFDPAKIIPVLSALSHKPEFAAVLSGVHQHLGLDLIHDVLPALGPFQLSVQGTQALSLGAGLVLRPSDPAAAQRVLAAIRRLVSHNSGLVVQGTKRSFTITKAGLPIPRVVVSQTKRHVVVTVDESPSQLLAPSSRLSTNSRFTSALSQLPAGSRVPLFIDFQPLDQLLQVLPKLTGGTGSQKLLGVVQRLDYLIAGSNQADGAARLVLGLR